MMTTRIPTKWVSLFLHVFIWLLPGILLVVVRYAPFQDWPGHIGISAAMGWHFDSQLDPLYYFRGWLGPNRLLYALALGFSRVLDADRACHVALAVFLISSGPSTALMLRSAGADWRWASALSALLVGRILACGFGPNVAALAPFALFLAGMFRMTSSPRHGAIWALIGGSLCLGLHAFVFFAGWGFLAATVGLFAAERRWSSFGSALAVLVALGLLLPLFGHAGSTTQQDTWNAVWSGLQIKPLGVLTEQFWTWLFAFHRKAKFDDIMQAIWLGSIVVSASLSLRLLRSSVFCRMALLFVACAIVAFVLLAENIGPPINWWGGNLRIPTLMVFPLVVLAGESSGRVVSRLRALALATSVAGFGFTAVRVVAFDRVEMAGFTELVSTAPTPRNFCAIHFSDEELHEFPGEPHWYASNYYLVHHPGRVAHGLFGNSGEPIGWHSEPKQAGWAHGQGFDWRTHWEWCDLVAIRTKDALQIPSHVKSRVIHRTPRWLLIEKTETSNGR